MSNTRYYNKINYANYGTFLDWAETQNTTSAVSSWDITLRSETIGAVYDLKINGAVAGGFQSPSVALSALWGYHAKQSGNASQTAFETAVGNPATVQADMGTLTTTSPEAVGQDVSVTFTNWDSAVAMPAAPSVTATLQKFTSATGLWSNLASSEAGTNFTYTLVSSDIGASKRVIVSSSGFMPLRFSVVGTPAAPTARTVDRTPFYINYFAATKESFSLFGLQDTVAGKNWTNTPLSSSPDTDFEDDTKNGRLRFIKDKWEVKALANGRSWKRVMIGNPAGYVAGLIGGQSENNQGYFSNNQGTGMSMAQADSFESITNNASIGNDNTTGLDTTWDSPFRPTGWKDITSGAYTEALGDSAKAWKFAIEYMKALPGAPEEVFAYIGYGYAYTDNTKSTFDNGVQGTLGYSPNWARSTKEPDVIDVTNWTGEWDVLNGEAGFDNASFDAGTRIARYVSDGNYTAGDARIAAIAGVVGTDNQIYEAIDRTPQGAPRYPTQLHYNKVKSWGLFPQSSGVEFGGKHYGGFNGNSNGNSVVQLDAGWSSVLNTSTSEVHIAFDINQLITSDSLVDDDPNDNESTRRQGTFAEIRSIIDKTVELGFIASATSWKDGNFAQDPNNDPTGVTYTAGMVADYLIETQPLPPGKTKEFTAVQSQTGTNYTYSTSNPDGLGSNTLVHYSLTNKGVTNLTLGGITGSTTASTLSFNNQAERDAFVDGTIGLTFVTQGSTGTFNVAASAITAGSSSQEATFNVPTWSFNAGDNLPLTVNMYYT